MPQASATAEPPEEPAAERWGSNALPVAPWTGLRVLPPAAHSGVLVLPKMMAPAARSRATDPASAVGVWFANTGPPQVVRRPLVSWGSLITTRRPIPRPPP